VSDEPTVPREGAPPPGALRTAAPPESVPADRAGDDVVVIETDPVVESPPVDDTGERDPAAVALDEADTVELSLEELRGAALAAVVDAAPPPDPTDAAPLDPMDPRMRDRRIAVTRAEGRRRLRILLAVVAVASALGTGWLLVQSPLLALDDVTIQGTMHETSDSVREAAGVDLGDPLLFVDEGDVASRVARLPWVAKVEVARDFPNGLRISVVERLPVAWIRRPSPPGAARGSGAAALVDRSGRILGDESGVPAGLPEITGSFRLGPPGSHLRPGGYARAVAELPDGLRAQVGAIVEDDGEAKLSLVAPPGGGEPAAEEIRLGSLAEIPAKGAAALAVLDQLVREESQVSYIDVRVPGAPASR
jgi:cell division protein FtsQ